jgi:hypothetical protein
MRASVFAVSALVFGAAVFGVPSTRDGVSFGTDAHATTSVLISLDEMVALSEQVAVATPIERYSQWEELGGGRRIVTYTKLSVEETITGTERGEVWVRTLGGKVDKIGQHVAGEAQFTTGERTVVFLAKAGDATVVTGMAQGHFPLVEEQGKVRLKSSPDTGTLLPRRGPTVSAREVLVGREIAEARQKILAAVRSSGK